MGKKVIAKLRLHIPGGSATPGPPVGPALGQHGLNIMQFCKAFNGKTSEAKGMTIPVDIQVFSDRSFTFQVHTPVTSDLIKEALKLKKGSGIPNRKKVGKIKREQLATIAKRKMPDLYAADLDAAIKTIAGTARSMGVDVID